MAAQEFEVITGEKIHHCKVFFNDITYRNFHYHGAFDAFLVMEGEGCVNLPGKTIPVQKGSLILLNPDESHEIDAFGGHVLLLLMQVSRQFCEAYLTDFRSLRFLQHDLSDRAGLPGKAGSPELKKNMLEAARLYFTEPPHYQYAFLSHVIRMFGELLDTIPYETISAHDSTALLKRTRRMNRLLDYIDKNYSSPIRLQDLADMEGLTVTHLSHLFTEQLGVSFQTYLNNLRFERAASILSSRRIAVSEAAYICGFSDPKYLNRMMQKRMGCTAVEFRDRAFSTQQNDPGGTGKVKTGGVKQTGGTKLVSRAGDEGISKGISKRAGSVKPAGAAQQKSDMQKKAGGTLERHLTAEESVELLTGQFTDSSNDPEYQVSSCSPGLSGLT